jgi:hypothetical protein
MTLSPPLPIAAGRNQFVINPTPGNGSSGLREADVAMRENSPVFPHKVGEADLDLHDLRFLAGGDRIDLLDVSLGHLLQAGVRSLRVILGDLSLL